MWHYITYIAKELSNLFYIRVVGVNLEHCSCVALLIGKWLVAKHRRKG